MLPLLSYFYPTHIAAGGKLVVSTERNHGNQVKGFIDEQSPTFSPSPKKGKKGGEGTNSDDDDIDMTIDLAMEFQCHSGLRCSSTDQIAKRGNGWHLLAYDPRELNITWYCVTCAAAITQKAKALESGCGRLRR